MSDVSESDARIIRESIDSEAQMQHQISSLTHQVNEIGVFFKIFLYTLIVTQ
jgi:hypothetical protein